MTAYNSAEHIKQAICSILEQDFKDWELIVVDDGSEDDTQTLLTEFTDPRIKVYRIAHSGHSFAKKEAFLHASGEYISFFDSDDLMHPLFLSVLYKTCVQTSSDIAVCRFSVFREEEQPFIKEYRQIERGILYDEDRMSLILTQNIRHVLWNKLYRRSVFHNFDFPLGDPSSDVPTCYRLFSNANHIAYIPMNLVYRRLWHGSMSEDRKAHPELYSVYRFDLYIEMLDYLWDHFPATRRMYSDVAKRELEQLERDGVIQQIDQSKIKKMQEKAFFFDPGIKTSELTYLRNRIKMN